MAGLDHLILAVTDLPASVDFYTRVLGFEHGGERAPFTVIRVSPSFTIQLAPWGTSGGQHLAFALSEAEFDAAFARIRAGGLRYGDSFHAVGNQQGPGEEVGSTGAAPSVYCFDPDEHLIEIRRMLG